MSTKRSRQPKPRKSRENQPPQAAGGEVAASKMETRLENEGFVVDLFLDKKRKVNLTQVLHVKSNDGEAWEGWNEKRLLEFFVGRAHLSLPTPPEELPLPKEEGVQLQVELTEPGPTAPERVETASAEIVTEELQAVERSTAGETAAPAEAELVTSSPGVETETEPDTEAATPPFAMEAETIESGLAPMSTLPDELVALAAETREPEPVGIVHGLQIVSARIPSSVTFLKRGEPFDIQLVLSSPNPALGEAVELDYTVSISAFRKGQNAKYFMAAKQGMIQAGQGMISVNIPNQNLEPGAYCFQATLTITSLPPESCLWSSLPKSVNLRSGLLQVI